MLNKIIDFADKYNLFPSSGIVLACVSGGADSMALLEALLDIAEKRGFSVSAAHFNHMLRGGESLRDEEFVTDYCAARSVPLYAQSGDVKVFASETGTGIEEAARDMRYSFFCAVADRIEAVRIATAHTADDNIETMIMNLTRGAGTAGLSGIPPAREGGDSGASRLLIRPMLRVSRDEVLHFIAERGIPFVEDSTNSLDDFTRNRVRLKVIPVIREMNPKYAEAAMTAAELLRADDEYLSGLADEFIREHCKAAPHNSQFSTLNSQLLVLPPAVAGRVIRKLCGGQISYSHVKAVLELCKKNEPSASLSLPGTVVFREYDNLIFSRESNDGVDSFAPIFPKDGDCIEIPGAGLELSCISVECSDILQMFNKSVTSFLLKKSEICGIITVRPRKEGDKIRFFGQNGTKTLKKLFIERRIPARKRNLVPVVADDVGPLAVYGIGMGDRAAPEPGDEAIQISFETIWTRETTPSATRATFRNSQ